MFMKFGELHRLRNKEELIKFLKSSGTYCG